MLSNSEFLQHKKVQTFNCWTHSIKLRDTAHSSVSKNKKEAKQLLSQIMLNYWKKARDLFMDCTQVHSSYGWSNQVNYSMLMRINISMFRKNSSIHTHISRGFFFLEIVMFGYNIVLKRNDSDVICYIRNPINMMYNISVWSNRQTQKHVRKLNDQNDIPVGCNIV